MYKYENITEQYMENKLIHLYTCAKNIATQEWANNEQCLYEEALEWFKYNMSIENYIVLKHTRITVYMDVFAKHEFVETLTMYAENNVKPLSFIFTEVNTEYSYVSGTLHDWVLFVTYCERNDLKKCDWRYCLNQEYSDIFDCLVKDTDAKNRELVGASVVKDTQLMVQCTDWQRHKSVTVRLEGTPNSVLFLITLDNEVYVTIGATNDNKTECYVTTTVKQWERILHVLERQDVYHRTQSLRELGSVIFNCKESMPYTSVCMPLEIFTAGSPEVIEDTGIEYDFWQYVDEEQQELVTADTDVVTFTDTLKAYNADTQEDTMDTVLLSIDDEEVTPETLYITE